MVKRKTAKKKYKQKQKNVTLVGALSPTGVGGKLDQKGGGKIFKVIKKN